MTGIGYRIRSTHGIVLDSWGGATGQGALGTKPDDSPDSVNRLWQLVPTSRDSFYRIKSTYGTVLDDWGGATGQGSLGLKSDDSPDSENRIWQIVSTSK